MATYKDYYKTLGVAKDASQKDIKRAFRKLAARYHPDKNPGDQSAEDKFKEINEAYTVLSDEEKRKFYDQFGTTDGRPPFAPGAGGGGYTTINPDDLGNFSDFFQSLFGGGGFGGTRTTTYTTRGGDPFGDFQGYSPPPAAPRRLDAELELDLETAYFGGERMLSIDGRSISVTIPKGARDGSKLRLRGQAPGGADLYLKLNLKPHKVFKLEGDNVRVTVDVPDYRAVLGGTVRVPTLDGDVEMSLPAGTQSGRVLRLRGQGWPKRDGSRGDELAEVRVTIPREVSEAQIELYERLSELVEKKETTTA